MQSIPEGVVQTEVVIISGVVSVASSELQALEERLTAQEQGEASAASQGPLTSADQSGTSAINQQEPSSALSTPAAMAASAVPAPIGDAIEKEERFLSKEDKGEFIRSYTPANFDPGIERIVGALQRLVRARTMKEHQEALRSDVFAKDLVWDAPFVMLRGKDVVRTALYSIPKTLFDMDLDPELVEVRRLPELQSHLVVVTGDIVLCPHRSWLLPPTLLLPKKLERKATFKLGITGSLENGKIELVYVRIHNVPAFPMPLRALDGFVLGNVIHLTEPLWRPILGFVRREERSPAQPSAEPTREAPPKEAEGRAFAPAGPPEDVGFEGMDYGPDDIGIPPGDFKVTDPTLTHLGYVYSPGAAIEHIGGAGPGWDSGL